MAGLYPTNNDRDWNLLKKIAENTANLADAEAGDVASITGTADQIVASQPTGAVVLSLPQSIATSSSPTFAAVTATSGVTVSTTGTGLTLHGGGTITGASGAITLTASGTNQSITLTPSGTGGTVTIGKVGVNGGVALTAGWPLNAGTEVLYGYKYGHNVSQAGNWVALGFGYAGNASTSNWFSVNFTAGDAMRVLANGHTLLGGLTTDGTGVLQFPVATSQAGGLCFGADTYFHRSAAGTISIDTNGASTNTQLSITTNQVTNAILLLENTVAGSSGVPALQFRKANNTADARITDFVFTNGSVLSGRFVNDAQTAATSWISITGTSSSITSIALNTGAGVAAVTIDSTRNATFSATIRESTSTKTGAGALSVTTTTTKYTTAGVADALTLADGTNGQIKRIILDVLTAGGHTAVLTPATKTGYTTITFSAAGQSATLQFVTTRGWIVLSSYGAVVA